MTTYGWLVMLVSVGAVAALFVWCIYKVLSSPIDPEGLHGFEDETPDEKKSRENRSQHQHQS